MPPRIAQGLALAASLRCSSSPRRRFPAEALRDRSELSSKRHLTDFGLEDRAIRAINRQNFAKGKAPILGHWSPRYDPHLAERLHSSDGEAAWNDHIGREGAGVTQRLSALGADSRAVGKPNTRIRIAITRDRRPHRATHHFRTVRRSPRSDQTRSGGTMNVPRPQKARSATCGGDRG